VGIGKYNGGGTQQLPLAVADDGLFDITLIRPMYWWQILFRLRKLFNGDIYSIGHVKHYRGRTLRIESTPEILVEVDGELLGNTPLEFKMRKQAVRVVVNKEFLERG
jgi:diacylglycerol kinase family enzyme